MLKNNVELNGIELSAIFENSIISGIDETSKIIGVTTDSREIENGNIFVAIKGEKYDGHDFVHKAYNDGASICIINREYLEKNSEYFDDKSFIAVENTIDALGEIAKFHRLKFKLPIIGVGGSNGKTTTKEMISRVLSCKFNVLKTYGNYNNQIGVPLMLMQLDDTYDMAVLEIGTNTPGEIYTLANIVNPTHALITNIGKEHLEFLIDLDGVELEETYLFSSVRSDGFAFINYDDERLNKYGHVMGKFTTYGIHEHAQHKFIYELDGDLHPKVKYLQISEGFEVNLNTIGYTSALNSIAAITVGLHFGVPKVDIIKALESFEPLQANDSYGRMAKVNLGDFSFYNDTYNANPDSMIAALKNIGLLNSIGRKFAILGDMKELGDSAEEEHKNVLRFAEEVCEQIIILGDEFKKAHRSMNSDKVLTFDSHEQVSNYLKNHLQENDSVLVKGSRGMKMEIIINMLRGECK